MASTNFARFQIDPEEIVNRRHWTAQCRHQVGGSPTSHVTRKSHMTVPLSRHSPQD